MKHLHHILGISIACLLTSCAVPKKPYYQVYKTETTGNLIKKEKTITYEDENCRISYDLWEKGGDIGFYFFNKTDKNIYLNLEECFFILNGVAFNYYKNRIYTFSQNTGATNLRSKAAIPNDNQTLLGQLFPNYNAINSYGTLSSSGYSTALIEEKTVCIPPRTSKAVTEYQINKELYRDCDLLRFPRMKQVQSKKFSKGNSPYVFGNRIAYSVGSSENQVNIEHEFYVSEITNFPENAITEEKLEEFCTQKSTVTVRSFKNNSPEKFYIVYYRNGELWKH